PEEQAVSAPGDMLYSPPQAAHDGIAAGDGCMTISIGFRAPTQATSARDSLEAAADQVMARVGSSGGPYGEPASPGPKSSAVYRDPAQAAVATPAQVPDASVEATSETVSKSRFDDASASRFSGCWSTEPSNLSVFDGPEGSDVDSEEDWPAHGKSVSDRRSRMLYRGKQLFINGETAMTPASP
ncbi:hypothetical protein OY671_010125, partial [Metschnikowia pulcherrima]